MSTRRPFLGRTLRYVLLAAALVSAGDAALAHKLGDKNAQAFFVVACAWCLGWAALFAVTDWHRRNP